MGYSNPGYYPGASLVDMNGFSGMINHNSHSMMDLGAGFSHSYIPPESECGSAVFRGTTRPSTSARNAAGASATMGYSTLAYNRSASGTIGGDEFDPYLLGVIMSEEARRQRAPSSGAADANRLSPNQDTTFQAYVLGEEKRDDTDNKDEGEEAEADYRAGNWNSHTNSGPGDALHRTALPYRQPSAGSRRNSMEYHRGGGTETPNGFHDMGSVSRSSKSGQPSQYPNRGNTPAMSGNGGSFKGNARPNYFMTRLLRTSSAAKTATSASSASPGPLAPASSVGRGDVGGAAGGGGGGGGNGTAGIAPINGSLRRRDSSSGASNGHAPAISSTETCTVGPDGRQKMTLVQHEDSPGGMKRTVFVVETGMRVMRGGFDSDLSLDSNYIGEHQSSNGSWRRSPAPQAPAVCDTSPNGVTTVAGSGGGLLGFFRSTQSSVRTMETTTTPGTTDGSRDMFRRSSGFNGLRGRSPPTSEPTDAADLEPAGTGMWRLLSFKAQADDPVDDSSSRRSKKKKKSHKDKEKRHSSKSKDRNKTHGDSKERRHKRSPADGDGGEAYPIGYPAQTPSPDTDIRGPQQTAKGGATPSTETGNRTTVGTKSAPPQPPLPSSANGKPAAPPQNGVNRSATPPQRPQQPPPQGRPQPGQTTTTTITTRVSSGAYSIGVKRVSVGHPSPQSGLGVGGNGAYVPMTAAVSPGATPSAPTRGTTSSGGVLLPCIDCVTSNGSNGSNEADGIRARGKLRPGGIVEQPALFSTSAMRRTTVKPRGTPASTAGSAGITGSDSRSSHGSAKDSAPSPGQCVVPRSAAVGVSGAVPDRLPPL